MPRIELELPEDMYRFLISEVKRGQSHDINAHIRDLIQQDMAKRAEERLDELILEGVNSGEPIPVTEEFWRELWQETGLDKAELSGAMEALLIEGLESGEPIPVTPEYWKELRRKTGLDVNG